jgi:hypothetical protein
MYVIGTFMGISSLSTHCHCKYLIDMVLAVEVSVLYLPQLCAPCILNSHFGTVALKISCIIMHPACGSLRLMSAFITTPRCWHLRTGSCVSFLEYTFILKAAFHFTALHHVEATKRCK